MARNGVWGTDTDILSAALLLFTDTFAYPHFGDTYKWQLENWDPRKLILMK